MLRLGGGGSGATAPENVISCLCVYLLVCPPAVQRVEQLLIHLGNTQPCRLGHVLTRTAQPPMSPHAHSVPCSIALGCVKGLSKIKHRSCPAVPGQNHGSP